MIDRRAIAALTLSAAGFVAILQSEGYSSNAIRPVKGDVPTIGFGTTEGVKDGDKITPPVAVKRALDDMAKYEGAIKQCVKVPLTQSEYDAYASLAYNIGPAAFCGSTLVKKLNAGDYAGACEQVLVWDKTGGRRVQGLTARRHREYAQCRQS